MYVCVRDLAKATFKIFFLGIICGGFCGCCGRRMENVHSAWVLISRGPWKIRLMEKLNNSEEDLWVVCGIGYARSYLKEFLMSKKEIEIKGKLRKDFFSFIFSIFIFHSCLKNTNIRCFCNSNIFTKDVIRDVITSEIPTCLSKGSRIFKRIVHLYILIYNLRVTTNKN